MELYSGLLTRNCVNPKSKTMQLLIDTNSVVCSPSNQVKPRMLEEQKQGGRKMQLQLEFPHAS